MKFTTATYQRVKNLGNYESERLEMTIEIQEDDEPEKAVRLLQLTVNQLLFLTQSETQQETDF